MGAASVISSGYVFPAGIAVDDTDVFFTDPSATEVRQVPKTGGTSIVRFSLSGTYPYSIKVSNGVVYWNDPEARRIYAMVK
jgi:hypothetical protein